MATGPQQNPQPAQAPRRAPQQQAQQIPAALASSATYANFARHCITPERESLRQSIVDFYAALARPGSDVAGAKQAITRMKTLFSHPDYSALGGRHPEAFLNALEAMITSMMSPGTVFSYTSGVQGDVERIFNAAVSRVPLLHGVLNFSGTGELQNFLIDVRGVRRGFVNQSRRNWLKVTSTAVTVGALSALFGDASHENGTNSGSRDSSEVRGDVVDIPQYHWVDKAAGECTVYFVAPQIDGVTEIDCYANRTSMKARKASLPAAGSETAVYAVDLTGVAPGQTVAINLPGGGAAKTIMLGE